jgi:hypothetical protein
VRNLASLLTARSCPRHSRTAPPFSKSRTCTALSSPPQTAMDPLGCICCIEHMHAQMRARVRACDSVSCRSFAELLPASIYNGIENIPRRIQRRQHLSQRQGGTAKCATRQQRRQNLEGSARKMLRDHRGAQTPAKERSVSGSGGGGRALNSDRLGARLLQGFDLDTAGGRLTAAHILPYASASRAA